MFDPNKELTWPMVAKMFGGAIALGLSYAWLVNHLLP